MNVLDKRISHTNTHISHRQLHKVDRTEATETGLTPEERERERQGRTCFRNLRLE